MERCKFCGGFFMSLLSLKIHIGQKHKEEVEKLWKKLLE